MESLQQPTDIDQAIKYAKVVISMVKQLNIDGELGGLSIIESNMLQHYIEQFEKNIQPKNTKNETW
mgnify:CR=1 FL=1